MKKFLAIAICGLMIVSLAACGKNKDNDEEEKTTTKSSSSEANSSSKESKKDSKVSDGVYEEELAKFAWWENKFRPQGDAANFKYGTPDAYKYGNIVSDAYKFANNEAIIENHKQLVLKDITAKGGINKLFGRSDNLIATDDKEFMTYLVVCDALKTSCNYDFSQVTEIKEIGDAYTFKHLKDEKDKTGPAYMLAVFHQMGAKISLCKGTNKSGAVNYWFKIIDTKNQTWYSCGKLYSEAEFTAAGNKITDDNFVI